MKRWVSLVLIFGLVLWGFAAVIEDLPKLLTGVPYAWEYVCGMVPPDWSVLPSLIEPLGETLRMAILSIAISSAVALGVSFLAAKNTSPYLVTYILARGFINGLRAMPTLLWALLFVSLVGLGPLAGVFGLVCHCVGTLGKYFSEAIEVVGAKIVDVAEAMRLDGAEEWQMIRYGLLPEVAPLFSGYILYYFEWCVRVGTMLGLVGAGGLGLRLTMSIRLFRRQETLAIVIVILVMVGAVDLFSRTVRAMLLSAEG